MQVLRLLDEQFLNKFNIGKELGFGATGQVFELSKDKAIKAAKKTKTKKIVKESTDIKNFITSISTKKYALAHKYLKQVIEDKIKSRISSSLNKPLF
jgi:hypothetical protein